MPRKEWENILLGKEVRQSLSKLRQVIKDADCSEILQGLIDQNEDTLIVLLKSDDAKTRKNAALLMGDLGKQDYLNPIWNAYQEEQQRFVKSSYLTAISNLDYRIYIDDIKERLDNLGKLEVTIENEKHVKEEMRELSALIVRMEGISKHTFTGWNQDYEVALITNRNFTNITEHELKLLEPNAVTKLVNVGVIAKVEDLRWTREIRTYQELLFIIKDMKTCPMDVNQVADTIIKSDLLRFISRSHDGKAPYYFRIEMKTKKDLSQKSAFIKKLSAQIEKESNRTLINTKDNYEFEIRLIENKLGNCNIMIKLYTLKDNRFTYRKQVIPTSIRPMNAALTVALAKEFLKEDAQVLDPFCGVGTMLIERHKSVRANTCYGIDIQEDAIIKARENTETAKQVIHYINRDFFSFEHNYLFDEVITNMPFRIGRATEKEIQDIYKRFFNHVHKYLREGAVLVLYSHNRDLVRQMISHKDYRLLKEYEISKREETYVIILRYK